MLESGSEPIHCRADAHDREPAERGSDRAAAEQNDSNEEAAACAEEVGEQVEIKEE